MKKVIVLIGIVFSMMAVPAQAQTVEVTGNAMAQDLNNETYRWAGNKHGKWGCPPQYMRIYVYDGNPQSDYGCQIWIQRSTWNQAQGWPIDQWKADDRALLWLMFQHERMHSAWVGHHCCWLDGSVDANNYHMTAAARQWGWTGNSGW